MNRKQRRTKLKLFRGSPADPPKIDPAEIERAVAHLQAEEFAAAQALLRRLLEIEPAHAEALHLLGLSLSQTGQIEESLALLRRAVELAPRESLYWNNLASALFEAGLVADAAMAAGKSVELAPDYARAWENLGLANATLGRDEQAMSAFKRFAELDRDNPRAWQAYGEAALAAGRPVQARPPMAPPIGYCPRMRAFWPGWGSASRSWNAMARQSNSCAPPPKSNPTG